MKVRLTTDRVHGFGLLQRQDEVVDVPEDEGRALVATGQAEPVIERAVARPPENTTRRETRRPGA